MLHRLARGNGAPNAVYQHARMAEASPADATPRHDRKTALHWREPPPEKENTMQDLSLSPGERERQEALLADLLTVLLYPGLWGIEKGRYGTSIPPLIQAGTDCFLIGCTLAEPWQVRWNEAGTLHLAAHLAATAIRAIPTAPLEAGAQVQADALLVLGHPDLYRLQRGNRALSLVESQDFFQVGLRRGSRVEWWEAESAPAAVRRAAHTLRSRAAIWQQGGRLLDLLPDSRSAR